MKKLDKTKVGIGKRYIMVGCDSDLYEAIRESARLSNRKLGPEIAYRMRRVLARFLKSN